MSDRTLKLAEGDNLTIYLKLKEKREIEPPGSMKINGATKIERSQFNDASMPDSNMLIASVSLSEPSLLLRTWTIETIEAGMYQLKKEDLDDILFLIKSD